MPKAKKAHNTYSVNNKKYTAFPAAAAAAVDAALHSGESVAISEYEPDGKFAGYINVEATGEPA